MAFLNSDNRGYILECYDDLCKLREGICPAKNFREVWMSQWVRLWDDMPADPKWRLIARRSGRSISEVMAVFNFMMINAGHWDHRGQLVGWDDEVVASALDLDESDVAKIVLAMQGLTLEGSSLKGWDKRQTKRADESTERVRAFRQRRNDMKRTETLCNAHETAETPEEKRREEDKKDKDPNGSLAREAQKKPKAEIGEILESCLSRQTACDLIEHRRRKKAPLTAASARGLVREFTIFGDPERAVQEMITQDWRGFKPDWMVTNHPRAGQAGRSNGTAGAIRAFLEEEDKNDDRARCQESTGQVIPMLSADRRRE